MTVLNGAPVSFDGLLGYSKLQDLLTAIINIVNEQATQLGQVRKESEANRAATSAGVIEFGEELKNQGSSFNDSLAALQKKVDTQRDTAGLEERLSVLEDLVKGPKSGGSGDNGGLNDRLSVLEDLVKGPKSGGSGDNGGLNDRMAAIEGQAKSLQTLATDLAEVVGQQKNDTEKKVDGLQQALKGLASEKNDTEKKLDGLQQALKGLASETSTELGPLKEACSYAEARLAALESGASRLSRPPSARSAGGGSCDPFRDRSSRHQGSSSTMGGAYTSGPSPAGSTRIGSNDVGLGQGLGGGESSFGIPPTPEPFTIQQQQQQQQQQQSTGTGSIGDPAASDGATARGAAIVGTGAEIQGGPELASNQQDHLLGSQVGGACTGGSSTGRQSVAGAHVGDAGGTGAVAGTGGSNTGIVDLPAPESGTQAEVDSLKRDVADGAAHQQELDVRVQELQRSFTERLEELRASLRDASTGNEMALQRLGETLRAAEAAGRAQLAIEIKEIRKTMNDMETKGASATARCLSCFSHRQQEPERVLLGCDGKVYKTRPRTPSGGKNEPSERPKVPCGKAGIGPWPTSDAWVAGAGVNVAVRRAGNNRNCSQQPRRSRSHAGLGRQSQELARSASAPDPDPSEEMRENSSVWFSQGPSTLDASSSQ